MPVILLGTLDTKGVEFQYVRNILCARGLVTLVIDAGVTGPPHFAPDIPRDRVYEAASTTLAAIQKVADRGQAIEAAARGMAKLVAELHRQGKVDAILGMVLGTGVRSQESGVKEDRSLLAATMFGVTTPCVSVAQKQLEAGGFEVLVFHA